MKKILLFVLCFVLALSSVALLVACSPKCNHENTSWIVTKSPTCTDEGVTRERCNDCGKSLSQKSIEKLDHNFGPWTEAVEPTCQTQGNVKYAHCSLCNKYYGEDGVEISERNLVLGAVDHCWESPEVLEPATCLTDGSTQYTCHWCQTTTVMTVEAKGHTVVTDEAVEATCAHVGYTEGSHCSECLAVLVAQEEVPLLEHAWNNGEVAVEGTCERNGEMLFTCENCQATRTEYFSGHVAVVDAYVAPTCTEQGLMEGSHCEKCGTVLVEQQPIEAIGHMFTNQFSWSWDGTDSASVVFVCDNDCQHTQSLPATVEKVVTLNPTCTETGEKTCTATLVLQDRTIQDVKTEVIPALQHSYYEVPVWDFSDGAKAIFLCQNDNSHKIVLDAEVSEQTVSAASCTENGEKIVYATVVYNNQPFTQQQTVTVPALGHNFSSVVEWTWNGTDSACAELVCEHNAQHRRTVEATVSLETLVSPTCVNSGLGKVIATVSVGENNFSDAKEVALPATGHLYTENVLWTWDGLESATATFVCAYNSAHTYTTEAVISSETTLAPTCLEDGTKVFTATASFENVSVSDAKTVNLEALGHDFSQTVWQWENYDSATLILVCSHDDSHTVEFSATLQSQVTEEPNCTANGTKIYTATVTAQGQTFVDTKTQAIAAVGHNYSDNVVWTWRGYDSVTATFVCANDATHTHDVVATVQSVVETAPTFTQDGTTLHTATATLGNVTVTNTKTEVVYKESLSIPISTAEDFLAIAEDTNKIFYLTNDINLDNAVLSPIENFQGILDGKGYCVKNFSLTSSSSPSVYAMFNVNSGTIKNISFVDYVYNVSASFGSDTKHYAIIVGTNNGVVSNVRLLTGSMQLNLSVVHGASTSLVANISPLVATNGSGGVVENCNGVTVMNINCSARNTYDYYDGHRTYGTFAIGGLVGRNYGQANSCGYIGYITVKTATFSNKNNSGVCYARIGGLVGIVEGGTVSNSYSEPQIDCKSTEGNYNECNIGGLVGKLCNKGFVKYSYSKGAVEAQVSSETCVGGLVGHNSGNASILTCYSETAVSNRGSSNAALGGFVGYNNSIVQNSYCSGCVDTNTNGNNGGFAGNNDNTGSLFKCYSTGDVKASGGSCGYFIGRSSGTISKCYVRKGSVLTVGGTNVIALEKDTLERRTYSQLWNVNFLVGELYWDKEGWRILTDQNPLLEWELTSEEHNFQTQEYAADCTNFGYTLYTCEHCGRVFIGNYVEALGHDWQLKEQFAATCTYYGYEEYECSRCHETVLTNYTDPLGHSDRLVTDEEEINLAIDGNSSLQRPFAAQCEVAGRELYYCSSCNTYYNVVVQGLAHNWQLTEELTAATCSREGLGRYKCLLCDREEEQVIEKLPHTFVIEEYLAPSCAANKWDESGNPIGWIEREGVMPGEICSECGYIKYGCVTIPAHSWVLQTTTKVATCTEEGSGHYVCQLCQKSEDQVIEKVPHVDVNKDSVCDKCNKLTFNETLVLSSFIEINSIQDLKNMENNPLGYYKLMCDLDFSQEEWTPLFANSAMPFRGVFYGGNHTISNLTFQISETPGNEVAIAGLFGYNNGTIASLKISNVTVKISNANAVFGCFAVYNSGTVVSCQLLNSVSFAVNTKKTVNTANTTVNYDRVVTIGAFVGENNKLVSLCESSATVLLNVCTTSDVDLKGFSANWQSIVHPPKITVTCTVNFGVLAGINRTEAEISESVVSGSVVASVISFADMVSFRGKAFAYTHLYVGSAVGVNYASVNYCTLKGLVYTVPIGNWESDYDSSMLYEYGYCTYNHSADKSGVAGVIGLNDGDYKNCSVT